MSNIRSLNVFLEQSAAYIQFLNKILRNYEFRRVLDFRRTNIGLI
jgi:hypothetical protein